MSALKLEIEIPPSVYKALEDHITACVTKAFEAKATLIQKQGTKLSRQEAAKKLRVSLPTLDKYIREEKIRTQTIGRRVLIPEMDLERFLNRGNG
jgi:excisionase family DNA binding protein